jgi:flagellar motor switch protein FliN
MPEDPEIPSQPSDAEEAAPKEAPAPEEAPDAVADQGPEGEFPAEAAESVDDAARPDAEVEPAGDGAEASPSEADRLAEEQMLAQMAAAESDAGDGAVPAGAPAEADRLAEEQMLAQMAEAEAAESPDKPAVGDIKEPSMDFPQPGADSIMAQSAEFSQLGDTQSTGEARSFDLLMDVKLPVSIELGRTMMAIADILALGGGSIVELDKLAGEPVDLLVNNKIIAQGEVVVVDENFGIRVTTLVSPQERIKSL